MSVKKTITGLIREMNVGEKLTFPLEKRIYIQNIISYRMKSMEPKKKWSSKTDNARKSVVISRIS